MDKMQSIKKAFLGMGKSGTKKSGEGKISIAGLTLREKLACCCELDNLLPQSVFITNPSGVLRYVNKHFMQTLGYDGNDVRGGLNFLSLLFPDKRKPDVNDLKRLVSRENENKIYTVSTKDGKDKQVTIQANILNNEGNVDGVRGVISYIEEIPQEEEKVKKVGDFESFHNLIGGIAHDFNNLLGVILGNLSMMQLRTKKDSPAQKNLTFIEGATGEAYDLTQQLLAFSKSSDPQKKIISISQLIEDTASLIFHGSDAIVEKKVQENLWDIPGDSGQLFQLFSNVLMNAREAVGDGGEVVVTAKNVIMKESRIADLHKGKYLKITVKDNGIGIPEKNLKQIFDPYFTTKQEGSGLGLSSCSMIIRKYKGYIAFKSKVNEGTECIMYLYAPELIDTKITKAKQDKKLYIIGKKILVMDDQEGIRTMLADMLKELGCEVTATCDGYEAIDKYQFARNEGRPFHAVILDLTVPGGMGGEETFKVLRKIDSGVRVMVTSGYTKNPMILEAAKYGFAGAIKKPYRLEQLSSALFDVFANKDFV